MKQIKLSVVIPCYNEEYRFRSGFSHYFSYLKKQKYPWELIFVNDGSKDDTLKLITNVTRTNKNIKCVTYKNNKGKGYAIVQGMKKAQGKYVLFTDIDHSVSINTIDSFFPYFEKGYDVVIGSRRVRGAKLVVRQKPLREILGRGFTLLVNLLIVWGVKDSTCGFKAFKQEASKKIFKKVKVFNWSFDAEILYICKLNNIKFAQAPVQWSDVSGSQVRLKKDIINSFIGLLKIKYNGLMGAYN